MAQFSLMFFVVSTNFTVLIYQEQLLYCAAKGGLSDLMKMLVSQDIDINAIDEVRLN